MRPKGRPQQGRPPARAGLRPEANSMASTLPAERLTRRMPSAEQEAWPVRRLPGLFAASFWPA
eukprot:1164615-Prymnesium_polylepis.1